MDNFKNNNRIKFIPGWLDSGELHGYKNSLDIWNKNIDIEKNLNADIVIAHSLGALVAIHNWNIHKNFKVILINPVFLKKYIFWRWIKSMFCEGTHLPLKRIIIFFSIISASVKAVKLFRVPAINILKTIPLGNLTIIYGEEDLYLYDRELLNSFNKDGVRIINVKESGHNYNANIEKTIIDIIKQRNDININYK